MSAAAGETHVEKVTRAFLDENPYAKAADGALSRANDYDFGSDKETTWLAIGQANATMAVAFEQRQSRFDLDDALSNHAQQTGRV